MYSTAWRQTCSELSLDMQQQMPAAAASGGTPLAVHVVHGAVHVALGHLPCCVSRLIQLRRQGALLLRGLLPQLPQLPVKQCGLVCSLPGLGTACCCRLFKLLHEGPLPRQLGLQPFALKPQPVIGQQGSTPVNGGFTAMASLRCSHLSPPG